MEMTDLGSACSVPPCWSSQPLNVLCCRLPAHFSLSHSAAWNVDTRPPPSVCLRPPPPPPPPPQRVQPTDPSLLQSPRDLPPALLLIGGVTESCWRHTKGNSLLTCLT
ncbi:hypothetical protein NQZ68_031059 [Dissostichus eleginoides]|nr:hypothetical protein NQZ68_031059 [Dissostichus eleginoides]